MLYLFIEIPTHIKYPIYRVTFASQTSIAQINHIRYMDTTVHPLRTLHFSNLPHNKISYTLCTTHTSHWLIPGLSTRAYYTTTQLLSPPPDHFDNFDLTNQIDQLKTTDLDHFLRIISLIQKHYINCTNNLDRVKATILIIKKLENGYP